MGRRRRWMIHHVGLWQAVKQSFIELSPSKRFSIFQSWMGSSIARWNMWMFVHWRNSVQSECVVMQLIQVGVSRLVDMSPGRSFNLVKDDEQEGFECQKCKTNHLGRNDARKVSGGFHQKIDIHTRCVGRPQLRIREQKFKSRCLKSSQHGLCTRWMARTDFLQQFNIQRLAFQSSL